MRLLLVATALVLMLLAPVAPSTAKLYRGETHQMVANVPTRIHEQIGFVPIAGIQPLRRRGALPPEVDIKVGRDTYRGRWSNFTISGRRETTSTFIAQMRRRARGRYGEVDGGLFADRPLTAGERRDFKVLVDLARDADVLVVKRGHPACGGLTNAQVVGIASGRITRWSQVVALPAGYPDQIALRHVQVRDAHEPRFGQMRRPRSARGSHDGGIAEAGANAAVAGVTSWSRVYARMGACAVPIDGIAPTDFSVHALTYRAAYPISFVVLRKRQRNAHARGVRAAYARFLRSERAAALFRQNGLIMATDRPQRPPPEQPARETPPAAEGPTTDGRGRPVTTTADADAARSTLTGERLEWEQYPAFQRLAFDANDVLHEVESQNQDGGACNVRTGTWTLIAGWRYPEHGGGVIARVRLDFGSPAESTIDFPGDDPGYAYVDGRRFRRDRSLPPYC